MCRLVGSFGRKFFGLGGNFGSTEGAPREENLGAEGALWGGKFGRRKGKRPGAVGAGRRKRGKSLQI